MNCTRDSDLNRPSAPGTSVGGQVSYGIGAQGTVRIDTQCGSIEFDSTMPPRIQWLDRNESARGAGVQNPSPGSFPMGSLGYLISDAQWCSTSDLMIAEPCKPEISRLGRIFCQRPVRSVASTCDFIEQARRLENRGFSDTALDLVYDSIDSLLHGGHFTICSSLLSELSVSDYSMDVLLALLTTTLPAKSQIATRADFLHRVENELRRRGELESELLSGLG